MKINQKIVRLIAVLLLVIFTTFSMSSCLLVNYLLYEDLFEEDFGSGSNNDNGGGNNQKPDNGDNNQNQNDNNQNPSDNIGEFYPGSGEGNIDNVDPIKQSLLSTVIVVAEFGTTASAGSGVFYKVDKTTGDAYIITNQHIVYSEKGISNKIRIYLYGMELDTYAIDATFVGGSVTYDIAVLKITGSDVIKNSYAKAVTLGKSSEVQVFDTVYTVGNPEAYGISATRGIVSVLSETIDLEGADGSGVSLRVMRTDASVNHGNSGGGLYDESGRLIGIVSAKTPGADVEGMGYAIPIDLVKNLVDNILYYCDGQANTKLNRALMGITITAYVKGIVIDPENGNIIEKELVEVSEVSATGIANGKVLVGDIVNSITVDGVKVDATQVHSVPEHMLNARIGSVVVMNVTRGNQNLDITFIITPECVTPVK